MITISELFKKILGLYSAHFPRIIVVLVPLSIVNIIASLLPESYFFRLSWLGVIIVTISFLISSFTELTLIGLFSQNFDGAPLSLARAMQNALKRLPGYLLLLILFGLIMGVGLIFAIIPAIIFGTWFIFISCAYLIDGTSIRNSFHRSKFLVRGNFFPLFIRVVLAVLFVVFIGGAASQGFSTIVNLFATPATINALTILSGIVGAIIGTLLIPIITATVVTLYYEMRKIKTT